MRLDATACGRIRLDALGCDRMRSHNVALLLVFSAYTLCGRVLLALLQRFLLIKDAYSSTCKKGMTWVLWSCERLSDEAEIMTPQEIAFLKEGLEEIKKDLKELRNELRAERDKCQQGYDAWLRSHTRKIQANSLEIAKMSGQAKMAGSIVALIASAFVAVINRLF